MSTNNLFLDTPDLTNNDYCIFGLATCFLKNDGKEVLTEIGSYIFHLPPNDNADITDIINIL